MSTSCDSRNALSSLSIFSSKLAVSFMVLFLCLFIFQACNTRMWRSAPETLRNLLSKYQRECLFQEESPRKADKRYKLEEIARRFVCELPHGSKFACQPVEALLRRAVEEAAPACFDPLQAAAAFAALEDYAVNLLVQPWRGEVHQVKVS